MILMTENDERQRKITFRSDSRRDWHDLDDEINSARLELVDDLDGEYEMNITIEVSELE